MRRTVMLAAAKSQRSLKSLALNVYFKHPDMKQYEILSRATAFLLAVDPLDPAEASSSRSSGAYEHLDSSRKEREAKLLKRDYFCEPAGGPVRKPADLNWLEFCPSKFRPLVHVVASSHVLSPWLWKQYYPQPWLEHVTQDHVRYSIDVYDDNTSNDDDGNRGPKKQRTKEPLATFALNPFPIHHPSQMDLAIVHLKDEDAALNHMKQLGVDILHLSDIEKPFNKDDEVSFQGFELDESHYEAMENFTKDADHQKSNTNGEDTRVFFNYKDTGRLIYASPTRFLATTNQPLPEGICGGPVIDDGGNACGVVEGIVPKDHADERIAGAASYIPHFQVRSFIDYAEKVMLKQIVPKNLFEKVIELKEGKPLENQVHDMADVDAVDSDLKKNLEEAHDQAMANIRKNHSPEEVEAIMATLEREQKEVMEILDREGGDVDEVVQRVRERTRQRQKEIFEQISEELGNTANENKET